MPHGEQKGPRDEGSAGAGTTFRETAPSHPIRDFIVEFFGVLLPGFAFTTGLIFTLVLPLYALIVSQRYGGVSHSSPDSADVWKVLESLQLPLLVAAAALSYVWGHVFYRLDTKLPDTISYWSLSEHDRKHDPVGNYDSHSHLRNCCERLIEPRTDSGSVEAHKKGCKCVLRPYKPWYEHVWESTNVLKLQEKIRRGKITRYPRVIDFPYDNLKEWFGEEGMCGLTRFVTWSGCEGGRRSRYLDLMKTTLEFTFPEQYARLARNEAHVRLVCSIWYATCYLICFSLIGIPIGVLANGLAAEPSGRYLLAYPAALLVPVVALLGLVWLKRNIEESVHAIRVREIVYVFAHLGCATTIKPRIEDVLEGLLVGMDGSSGAKPDAAGHGNGEHPALNSWNHPQNGGPCERAPAGD
jgi:hypothetical protein